MNILILNWRDPKNPLSGGAEYVTMQHAKSWVKSKNSVTWFTSRFVGSKATETISGIKIVRKGSPLTVHLCAVFFYLFSGNKFDIVIDEIHGIPFFTPLYVQKPIIAFIHEVAGDIWDYMYPFPINKIGKLVENLYFLFYKNIPFWVDAPSTIKDLVAQGIERKHCDAIACPIGNAVIQSIPVKEKVPTYIFVSRIVKMKGIERIVEAFTIIQAEQQNAELWIVGGGDPTYIRYVKSTMKHLKSHVTFFGKVSESKKLKLMRQAHMLLHASVKEGWGLVVLEAASQATPAVVYNIAGLRDTVRNGKTGIVIEENSPQAMADAVLRLSKNKALYSTLQKNGLQWVKSLTWSKATEESLTLLSKITYGN